MPKINREELFSLPLILPPLPEQKKIAEILSTWDKAIEILEALIEAKEKRKKGLMQQLLTGKKRLPGFGKPAKDGEIPEGWKSANFGDLFARLRRTDEESNNTQNVYTISAGKGFLSQEERFSRVIAGSSLGKYTHILKNEFAYNKGNSKTYPFGCIYKFHHGEGLIPFVYISFAAREEINHDFYGFYFENRMLDRQLKKLISSSARSDGLLNVSTESFFKIRLFSPSIFEQDGIAALLNTALSEISIGKSQLHRDKTVKKGLMQKLLTGEIKVKV